MGMGKSKVYSAFVLMPFSKEHKNTYEVAIKEACRSVREVSCHRLDDSALTVNLIDEMYFEINRADIIIADLSGLNPNVLYEVGYAFGVNKQIFLLTDDVNNLPFNLKPLRHIVFSKDDLPGLKKELSNVLREYVRRYDPVEDPNINPNPDEEPLPLRSWSAWGGIEPFSNSNTVLLQGTAETSGYVCDKLDKNLAGKVLILYISNTKESQFSMNRLIKVTVTQNDRLLKPKTNLHLIKIGKPPALPGDSKSLTFTGVLKVFKFIQNRML
jgi:hypothetical protein